MLCQYPRQSHLTRSRAVLVCDGLECISKLDVLVEILFGEAREQQTCVVRLEGITRAEPVPESSLETETVKNACGLTFR
jgi:hypothetical protein